MVVIIYFCMEPFLIVGDFFGGCGGNRRFKYGHKDVISASESCCLI